MDVIEAIHKRHSVPKVKPDPVPRELIEKLLDAGNQAPNHYTVRPWRFFVLTGDARKRLGDVMAASQKDRFPDLPAEGLDKTRALPLRAPVLIALGVDKPAESRSSKWRISLPLLLQPRTFFLLHTRSGLAR